MTESGPRWTGKVEVVENHLNDPLKWKEPRRIFVNSMSDLFHEALAFKDIMRIFNAMNDAPQHQYQILTKRAGRMREFSEWYIASKLDKIPDHISLGVSVEDQASADERLRDLVSTITRGIRFVSYEPALDRVSFADYISAIDWIIVGGESGPGSRPCDLGWIRETVRICKQERVPVFVKQLGADPRDSNANGSCRDLTCIHPECGYIQLKLNDRKGGDMQEWSEDLRIREFPR